MRIDIWSDIVCPFCYLGEQRLNEALAAWEHGNDVNIVWHSFELDPTFPENTNESLASHIATKYGVNQAQAEVSQQAIADQFAAAGASFDWKNAKPGNTFNAHRLLHLAAESGRDVEVMNRFMQGYFAEGAAIGDPEILTRLAVDAGLDESRVREVLASQEYADAVRSDEAQAQQLGITGVPFFVFDQRLGLSGAQPAEIFTQALNQAWDSREPTLTQMTGNDDAEACGPDGCAYPPAAAANAAAH